MERERKISLFAGIMAILVGVSVFVGYILFWVSGMNYRLDFPTNFWQDLGRGYLALFVIASAAVLALSFGYWSLMFFEWLGNKLFPEVSMPVLYQCDNNGVTTLITNSQREEALKRMRARGGNILLVPDAMVFTANEHFYPIRLDNIRTGNYADIRHLTVGCLVKFDSIHVNFSSFNMVDKTYQCANFHPPKFAEARRTIDKERRELSKAIWLRRNTLYAALVGFALTVLAFGAGMIVSLSTVKTGLFVCSGLSLSTALWAVRRLNSIQVSEKK